MVYSGNYHSDAYLLFVGCAAHSRNWQARLEVTRPPSCSTASGRTAGHTSSRSSRTWSKCCSSRTEPLALAPTLSPACPVSENFRKELIKQASWQSQENFGGNASAQQLQHCVRAHCRPHFVAVQQNMLEVLQQPHRATSARTHPQPCKTPSQGPQGEASQRKCDGRA